MSTLIESKETLFFASVLFHQDLSEEFCINKLESKYGPGIVFRNLYYPMKNYYSKEMGPSEELFRFLFLSPNLYDRRNIVTDKLWADSVEKEFSILNKRKINIDVGFQSLEQIVLATGKQFTHRIYLDRGVYLDLNLIYESDSYKSLSWTYPDYAHNEFIQFFNWSRNLLLKKLNH